MLELPSKYVKTLGYTTHYVEAGAGAPVVFIHGGGAGADGLGNWQHCIPHFTPHFRALAYDMVGFGKSDAPDVNTFAYDKSSRTEQAIAFIEALNLAPANIIGNSMGSAVALGVAMRRPDLVNKLVLMGAAGLDRKVPAAIAATPKYDFSMEAMRGIIRALTRPGFELDETLVQYRFNLLHDKPEKQAAYKRTQQVVIDSGGLYYEDAEIAAIKAKTLVFHGKDDKIIPPRDAFRMLELIPEAHAYYIPHCGHWAMMEQPDAFSRVSRDFLLHA